MIKLPSFTAPTRHTDAASALAEVQRIYAQATEHLKTHLQYFTMGHEFTDRVRACYPFVRLQTDTVLRDGRVVKDKTSDSNDTIKLPDERHGLLFVFRTFERMSYALILTVKEPVRPGDRFTQP